MEDNLLTQQETEFVKLGKQLIRGAKVQEIELAGQKFVFSQKQADYISNLKDRFCLYSGGYGCGKSLALYIKLILFAKCFPGIKILLGRRTLMDLDRTVLPDLFDLMPRAWYQHRVKDALINFKNGSQVILFGLEALQEGSMGDIKKAQQKLKSLNIGSFFIDQLEEVELKVFDTLDTRMRQMVPVQQGNSTCNPANFWAYDFFKANPKNGTFLVEGSMLDNKDHLKDEYLQQQLSKDDRWVRRYVMGEWTPDVLTDTAVFAPEHIRFFEAIKHPPISLEENCEIYEQPIPGMEYQMGVDPSEGVIDPSSISVVSLDGKKVAKWNGKIPIHALAERVKFLYYKYHKPLIVPEANAAGAALVEAIRDLRVYRRREFEYEDDRETEKLGFKMSFQSKKALIAHFQDLLRKGFPKIYDDKTIQELKTFCWTDSVREKGAGAQGGFHDDDIISTMLAFWEMIPRGTAIERELLKVRRFKPKSFI